MPKQEVTKRSVQAIFNVVMESGRYQEALNMRLGMCMALHSAQYKDGIITFKERNRAYAEIAKYMKYHMFLRNALMFSELPHGHSDMTAIYQNWKKRPVLKHHKIE